jgi:hypothetical protein
MIATTKARRHAGLVSWCLGGERATTKARRHAGLVSWCLGGERATTKARRHAGLVSWCLGGERATTKARRHAGLVSWCLGGERATTKARRHAGLVSWCLGGERATTLPDALLFLTRHEPHYNRTRYPLPRHAHHGCCAPLWYHTVCSPENRRPGINLLPGSAAKARLCP